MFKKMIFTPVTLRVLEYLGEDPVRFLHSREVARYAGVSSGAASLVLRRLHRAHLLELEKKGRMRFYRVNLSNPVSRQFKVLFNLLGLDELVEALSAQADRVVLFGSSAEGTDSRSSDLDLFILTQDPPGVKKTLTFFRGRLGRNLSPIIVDGTGLARLRRDDRTLYENITRGIVLWQRE